MSECLLCKQGMKESLRFVDILLFKKMEAQVCLSCRAAFVPKTEEACPSCSKSGSSEVCQDCRYWEKLGLSVDHKSLYDYTDEMAAYFNQYKFQGDYLLRKVFAKELKLYLSAYSDYTLVPIPLGPKRLAERGFNQVEGILEAAGLTYQPLLGKMDTQRQSEKSRKERLEAEQVFYLLEEKPLPEKIILIDDIYTTGASIQLAKRILMKNGKKRIKSFSIAR